jgi:hypothetical protein
MFYGIDVGQKDICKRHELTEQRLVISSRLEAKQLALQCGLAKVHHILIQNW